MALSSRIDGASVVEETLLLRGANPAISRSIVANHGGGFSKVLAAVKL
jgi:hypothetical protein